jgi:uncharacterized membrane protein YjdF
MKLILEGFWDQVCSRKGWSNKIGKWQWLMLQIIVPAIIVIPFLLWMVSRFENYTLKQALIFICIFFPVTTLSNSGAWDKDQKDFIKDRGET